MLKLTFAILVIFMGTALCFPQGRRHRGPPFTSNSPTFRAFLQCVQQTAQGRAENAAGERVQPTDAEVDTVIRDCMTTALNTEAASTNQAKRDMVDQDYGQMPPTWGGQGRVDQEYGQNPPIVDEEYGQMPPMWGGQGRVDQEYGQDGPMVDKEFGQGRPIVDPLYGVMPPSGNLNEIDSGFGNPIGGNRVDRPYGRPPPPGYRGMGRPGGRPQRPGGSRPGMPGMGGDGGSPGMGAMPGAMPGSETGQEKPQARKRGFY